MHKKDPAGWRGGVTARVLVWCAALVVLPSIAAFADDGEPSEEAGGTIVVLRYCTS